MTFTVADLLNEVEKSANEATLASNWLVRLLDMADPNNVVRKDWELLNQIGRKDISLIVDNRERCVIELKSPSLKDDLMSHFEQVYRYTYPSNYWQSGLSVPPLGILTNGRECIVFDGSIENMANSLQDADKFILDEAGTSKLIQIIDNIANGKLGCDKHKPPRKDNRNVVIDHLVEEMLSFYDFFVKEKVDEPFEYMLQMYLVAILRDCGYIPTSKIALIKNTDTWEDLTNLLNVMFNSNFVPLNSKNSIVIDKVYQDTRRFKCCLNRVPSDGLGMVYEKLLHKIARKQKNKISKTSFYTPSELIDDIINKIAPSLSDTILDPTCGSGAFLTGILKYLANTNSDFRSYDVIKSYIESNQLCGVDRDIYACVVSQTMLLATIANIINFDPAHRDIILPKINCIINEDIFVWQPRAKFSVIVGNLPWGAVDGKNKDAIINPLIRKTISLNKDTFQSYSRNVDVSCVLLERISKFIAKPQAKIGVLVKQQCLNSSDMLAFMTYAKKNSFKFWDYGDIQYFDNPASLTAIAWKGVVQDDFIVDKYVIDTAVTDNSDPLIISYGHLFKGFESSSDPLFREIAAEYPCLSCIKDTYPSLNASENFYLRNSGKKIAFVRHTPEKDYLEALDKNEEKYTKLKLQNKNSDSLVSFKQVLAKREQVCKKYPFSWRGQEGYDFYSFKGNQMRIFFPRMFTYGKNMYAMLDEKGIKIPLTSHVVFIPNLNITPDLIFSILAWFNCSYFRSELMEKKIPMLAKGGFRLGPKTLKKVRIPKYLMNNIFSSFIKTQFNDSTLTVEKVDQAIIIMKELYLEASKVKKEMNNISDALYHTSDLGEILKIKQSANCENCKNCSKCEDKQQDQITTNPIET